MIGCDIVVHGLGLAGRAVFQRLADAGVDVVGYDPRTGWVRPGDAPLWTPATLGLRLPCHLELPSRFLRSMGRAGSDLVAAAAAHAGNGSPVGVDWVHADAEPELAACRELGLRVERIPGGFRLLDGAMEVDPPVRTRPSEPAEGELTVWASWLGERWLQDKGLPVRWQSIGVRRGPPTISRLGTVLAADGRLWGARWATPHLQVGETEPVPDAKVTATLVRLAEQDGIGLSTALQASFQPTAGIVFESCDALPIIGPIPGRPREAVITGFGIAGRTWLALAVDHLVASMLAGPAPSLPACLGTARFR